MREEAVQIGAEPTLSGVWSPGDGDAFLLLNAGLIDHGGPHRLHVLLARALRERGIASLRFDLSGLGDSPKRTDNTPFRASLVEETVGAMDWAATEHDCRGFVLAGLCSGADQAFQVALRDERVRGCVLLDPYPYPTWGFRLRRWGGPLTRAETWRRLVAGESRMAIRLLDKVSGDLDAPLVVDPGLEVRDIPAREDALEGYRALLDRGCRLYVIYTAGQLGSYNHAGQFAEMFPELDIDGRQLRVEYLDGADHTLTLGRVRAELVSLVTDWATKVER